MRNLKKILALVLALMMALSVMVFASAKNLEDYEDAADVSAQYTEAVDVLTGIGIYEGDEEGFRPQDNITRAEVAALVYRLFSTDTDNSQAHIYAGYATNAFDDLTENVSWANGYIGYAAHYGYVVGSAEGQFDPTGDITGYELLAILLRAVGYDQNGEFEGEAWATNVAEVATQRNILVGFNTSLSSDLTREEVAYLMFRTIQISQVRYTPAFGYQPIEIQEGDGTGDSLPGVNLTSSLGYENFGLTLNHTQHNVWGRPYYTWTGNGNTYATIEYPVTVDFNTAETECDVVVAMGEDDDVTVDTAYLNGQTYQTSLLNGKRYIDATETTDTIGAQGRLTEIYSYVDRKTGVETVDVVMLDQFLAKVTNVTEAVYDDAGHLDANATITLDIYDGNSAPTAAGVSQSLTLTGRNGVNYTYAKGDMVLVYVQTADWNDDLTTAEDYAEIISEAPATIATQSSYRLNEYSVIGGDTYYWAEQYHMGNHGVNGTSYVVYTDTYGNLIGLGIPTTLYGYGIIADIAWQDSDHLADEYIEANLVTMTGTSINNVEITNAWKNNGNGNGNWISLTDAGVSEDKDKNGVFNQHLFQYIANTNGTYTMTAVEQYSDNDADLNPNLSYILFSGGAKPVVNDNTVYLVKTLNAAGQPVYTSYTGYKNVPAMTGASVDIFANETNSYCTYVYVDATSAIFDGSTELAIIFDGAYDERQGTLYGYDMYIDGVEVTRYVSNTALLTGDTLTGTFEGGLYLLTYDANGNIRDLDQVTFTSSVAVSQGVTVTTLSAYYCDGQVIRNNTVGVPASESYTFTGADVYLIDYADDTVTIGDYTDVADATGVTNYLILNSAGTAVVATYVDVSTID